MKCVSCGGEVASDQELCPYCNTVNEAAVKKKRQIGWKIWKNKELEADVMEGSKGYRWNKILNRTIAIMVILLCILMVIHFISYIIREEGLKALKPPNISQMLAESYKNQDFDRLDALLEQYDLAGSSDYHQYTQIAAVSFAYERFSEERNGCIEQIDRGEIPEDDSLYFVLDKGLDILSPQLGLYDELEDGNQKVLEEYKEGVEAFFRTYLKLEKEELEDVLDSFNDNGYIAVSVINETVALVIERLGE